MRYLILLFISGTVFASDYTYNGHPISAGEQAILFQQMIQQEQDRQQFIQQQQQEQRREREEYRLRQQEQLMYPQRYGEYE